MSQAVSLKDIQEAQAKLRGVIYQTPIVERPHLGELVGMPLFFKCENMQLTGAFKIRGSYNKIVNLDPEERKRGVITASSGNSGCATAYAGKLLGIRTVVVTSMNPAPAKRAACEAYGAEVLFVGHTSSERLQRAMELVEEQGLIMAHPYDDVHVIAGQGTIGLEILEQLPDVQQVVIQVGGGGLISGVATALRESGFKGKIVGVEPEICARMAYAMQQGKPDVLPNWRMSVGDGISSNKAGVLTYPLVKEYVDQLVTVSEEEIIAATKLLIESGKLFAEPSGAATFAAAMGGKLDKGLKTVCLISGGNTDLNSLHNIVTKA